VFLFVAMYVAMLHMMLGRRLRPEMGDRLYGDDDDDVYDVHDGNNHVHNN
jgi:hypothetical protein